MMKPANDAAARNRIGKRSASQPATSAVAAAPPASAANDHDTSSGSYAFSTKYGIR